MKIYILTSDLNKSDYHLCLVPTHIENLDINYQKLLSFKVELGHEYLFYKKRPLEIINLFNKEFIEVNDEILEKIIKEKENGARHIMDKIIYLSGLNMEEKELMKLARKVKYIEKTIKGYSTIEDYQWYPLSRNLNQKYDSTKLKYCFYNIHNNICIKLFNNLFYSINYKQMTFTTTKGKKQKCEKYEFAFNDWIMELKDLDLNKKFNDILLKIKINNFKEISKQDLLFMLYKDKIENFQKIIKKEMNI